MPASIAGLPARAGRIGAAKKLVTLRRLASRRPCHAQAAFAGEQGVRPLGSPLGKWTVGGFSAEPRVQKLHFRGFARRNFALWLRRSPPVSPNELRSFARRALEDQRRAPEFAAMPGNSHSHVGAFSPVFVGNGSVRSAARTTLWQNGRVWQQSVYGWSCSRPPPCRYTTRRSPIRAFASSSAFWRKVPLESSSQKNGSARPAIAVPDREAA
jgi:hypothetical protein